MRSPWIKQSGFSEGRFEHQKKSVSGLTDFLMTRQASESMNISYASSKPKQS